MDKFRKELLKMLESKEEIKVNFKAEKRVGMSHLGVKAR